MALAMTETSTAPCPITRAVWSYWPIPFQRFHKYVWASEWHHWLAWILSVERARRYYPETVLYTDDEGAALLVDGLGLPFTQVSTELNQLRDADPEWWALGKLHAYRAQSKPFVHIDTDVFLWNPLPPELTQSAVFAQNIEEFPFDGYSWYRPKFYDEWMRRQEAWIPEEWSTYVSAAGNEALCCGILGGQRTEFISHYAAQAIEFLTHEKNRTLWPGMENRIGDNILFEQYFLRACLAHHSRSGQTRFGKLDTGFLFGSARESFHSNRAREIGYTHLIGGAKKNPTLAARLEERVAKDHPALYARCLRFYRSVS